LFLSQEDIMRVTVCELNDDPTLFSEDWDKLALHVQSNASELVLLNELPFSPWFGVTPKFEMERVVVRLALTAIAGESRSTNILREQS
jgi:hypothetical protein